MVRVLNNGINKTLVLPGSSKPGPPGTISAADLAAIGAGLQTSLGAQVAKNTADLVKVTAPISSTNRTITYISETGDDANSGTTTVAPIKTMTRLLEVLKPGSRNIVYVSGTVNSDKFLDLNAMLIEFKGVAGTNAALSINNTSNAAIAGTFGAFSGPLYIRINDIKIILNSTATLYPAAFATPNCDHLNVSFRNCTFESTPTNVISLILAYEEATARGVFVASPIAAIAGKVFKDVAAGSNPNTEFVYTSNITAA